MRRALLAVAVATVACVLINETRPRGRHALRPGRHRG